MTQTKRLLFAVTTAACFWPLVAAAQEQPPDAAALLEKGLKASPELGYTSEVEAGVGYNTEDSFKFGEYRGLEDAGPYGIGNFSLGMQSPYNGEDSFFLRGTGTDLGLDSRSVRIEGGRQGTVKVFLDYDQTPRNQIDDARTPFLGSGSGNLTLPAGWVSGTSTAAMTNLNSSLTNIEVKTERKKFSGGMTWNPLENWKIKASASRELKEGTDTIGASIASSGGNPRAAVVPEPIDYVADDFDVSVGYTGKRFQAELSYALSMFSNKEDSLRFENPYSGVGGWDAAASYPTGVGEIQLPPDNLAHHASLAAGYTFGETTRLTGSFIYGRMEQDESFLPYTANSALTITTPLPRDSLDGEIETYQVNLGLATRPLPGLDFDARYRFDFRDNNTPQDTFIRITGDAEDQGGLATDSARINLPYSYEQHKVDLEAGYRVLPRTKISLGYEYDRREREFEVVSTTQEHTVKGKVRTTPFDFATASLEYGHGMRSGSTYSGNRPFFASHSPEFLASGLTPGFDDLENDPRLRKFWVADRDRDYVNGSLMVTPMPEVTVGLSGNYTTEDYGDTVVGLTGRDMYNGTLDVSYSPVQKLTLYGYATYEDMKNDQAGCDFSNNDPNKTTCFYTPSDTTLDWTMETHDRIWTFGTGFQASVIDDLLTFGADYSFSRGITSMDPEAGSAVGGTNPPPPLPDLQFLIHSFNLHMDYKPRDDVSVRFAYVFEKLSSRDFGLDEVGVDTVTDVIGLGEDSPDYRAHVFGVSVAYRF